MNANADHYTTGKNRHRPCEDYAISGLSPIPYIIVSDGCSSSPGSHMGAMLLTLAARKLILNNVKAMSGLSDEIYRDFGKAVIRQAGYVSRFLCLPETALDATLMAAWAWEDQVFAAVYGDGFIIAKRKDALQPRIIRISFETNAPYYLSYHLDKGRNERYAQEMQGFKFIGADDDVLKVPYEAPVFFRFPLETFSTVILASDGLGSFIEYSGSQPHNLNTDESIAEFTGFKNYAGEFVKRRAKRAVMDFEKRSVFAADDIGIAAIHVTTG